MTFRDRWNDVQMAFLAYFMHVFARFCTLERVRSLIAVNCTVNIYTGKRNSTSKRDCRYRGVCKALSNADELCIKLTNVRSTGVQNWLPLNYRIDGLANILRVFVSSISLIVGEISIVSIWKEEEEILISTKLGRQRFERKNICNEEENSL